MADRLVRKLEFLDKNRLKTAKNRDSPGKSALFRQSAGQTRLGREAAGLSDKSNVRLVSKNRILKRPLRF
jgi:hypothetical protein